MPILPAIRKSDKGTTTGVQPLRRSEEERERERAIERAILREKEIERRAAIARGQMDLLKLRVLP